MLTREVRVPVSLVDQANSSLSEQSKVDLSIDTEHSSQLEITYKYNTFMNKL